jgi:hypothetical protein
VPRQGLFGSRTLANIGVSVFALIGGALLAWWQWTRYESASGTLQNLGYVLQWPLFGVFPGFMFWRIRKAHLASLLEDQQLAVLSGQDVPAAGEVPRPADPVDDWTSQVAYKQNRTVTYQVDEDIDLLAYNSYLSNLSAREQRHDG